MPLGWRPPATRLRRMCSGHPLARRAEPAGSGPRARAPPNRTMRGLRWAAVDTAIRVSGLTKQYGSRTAFRDLTFEVGMGEVFGFLGPNGAGKTTTVRVLGTLIRPTSGTAVVAGVPVAQDNGPELRSRIAVMPESPGLYLRLTVYDNLEYFAGLYGV